MARKKRTTTIYEANETTNNSIAVNAAAKKKTTNTIGWKKVEAPEPWHPEIGESLEGTYLGSSVKINRATQEEYVVHTVKKEESYFTISGTFIHQLFEIAKIAPGSSVKIVFLGIKETSNGFPMKKFELYVPTY